MGADEQTAVVFSGVKGYLDKMLTSEIPKFEQNYLNYLKANHKPLLDRISATGELTDDDEKELAAVLETFIPEGGYAMKN